MKTIFTIIFLILNFNQSSAYTFWTAMNPWQVCKKNKIIKMNMMVNTGAGGVLEMHRLDREFISCQEVDGKIVLEMSLYHKSNNDMEAGYNIRRGLHLPLGFCSKTPDIIKFNYQTDPEITRNGKFRGPRTLYVDKKCSKL